MKKLVGLIVVFALMFPMLTVVAEDNSDPFVKALAAGGLTPDDVRWDMDKLSRLGSDPFRLYWFNEIWSKPLLIPQITRQSTDRISIYNNPESQMELNTNFMYGFTRISGYVAAFLDRYLPELDVKDENPFKNSLMNLYEVGNWRWGDRIENHVEEIESELDDKTATVLAEYVLCVKHLLAERERVFSKYEADEELFRKLQNFQNDEGGVENYRLAEDCDLLQLGWACARVVFAVQKLKNHILSEEFSIPDKVVRIPTPNGWIVLNGSETNDKYIDGKTLLLIDTYGNDTYEGGYGATTSFANCASVVIDLAGNDTYTSQFESNPSFGSGTLGCGIVLDLGGNDTYEAISNTQGCGLFGVGILADYAGDDIYSGVDMCQGAASFGLGLCLDYSGDDTYNCYIISQGFGFSGGYGLLYDRKGNDTYDANDTDILFPSAQNANHNTSMSQGAGYGRRADMTDGHSMSGGYGLLVDDAGEDSYSCGVFGQGVAYWYGVGVLSDRSGNDSYSGLWYVQGASAHYAISLFRDEDGDDVYQAKQATSIGVGHDFSTSWHIDTGGDDVYKCWREETDNEGNTTRKDGGLMLGCGNENGIGILVNVGGNDLNEGTTDRMYGGAYINAPTQPDTIRNEILCLGLFLDFGGEDSYGHERCSNNSNWIRHSENRPMVQVGIGADYDYEFGEIGVIR